MQQASSPLLLEFVTAARSTFLGFLHFGEFSLIFSWGLCYYYLDVNRSLLEGVSSAETNNFVYGWEMIILSSWLNKLHIEFVFVLCHSFSDPGYTAI